MQECRYTVCRPVQTTSYKTVAKTCYQTVTETACREVCEKVCVPTTVMKPVCRTYNEAVVQRYYVPGKSVCINGCLYECPGTWCEKTVCCPRTVTENVECTVYESQVVRKQVPYTICKKVPYTVCEQVPVTTCQMVAEECVKQVPGDDLPDGERDLRQAGAGHRLRIRGPGMRQAGARTPFAGTFRKPATRRFPTRSARCSRAP